MKFNLISCCVTRRSDLPGVAADSTSGTGASTGVSCLQLIHYCFFLAFVFASLASLLAQDTDSSKNPHPLSLLANTTSGQSKSASNTGDLGEFQEKVKARYQVARNGIISISIPLTCKAGDIIEAKVVIQRPPEGSDGLVSGASTSTDRSPALLKVDDEMQVRLSAEKDGAIQIQTDGDQPQQAIRRVLPGGHAEWIWHVKVLEPGEKHLIVTSDVVYRRNFLSYAPPIVRFTASTLSVPVQVLPQ